MTNKIIGIILLSFYFLFRVEFRQDYFRTCVIDNDEGKPFGMVSNYYCDKYYPIFKNKIKRLENNNKGVNTKRSKLFLE